MEPVAPGLEKIAPNQPFDTTGFLIRLYRRLNNAEGASNDDFQYLSFGFFDGFSCDHSVSQLVDYYSEVPGQDSEWDGNNNLDRIYEEQRICLYSRRSTQLKNDILDPNRIRDKPLIVISELKLSDRVLKNATLDDIEDSICAFINEHLHDESVQFELFRSLGHSEFICVQRCASFKKSIQLIQLLRDHSSGEIVKHRGLGNIPFLKSTYSITGASRELYQQLDTTDPYDISINVSLKSFNTVSKLLDGLKGTDYHDPSLTRVMFGKYDLVALFRGLTLKQAVELLDHDKNSLHPQYGIFDPQNAEFSRHINFTNTRWLIPVDPCQSNGNHADTFNQSISKNNQLDTDKLKNVCDYLCNEKDVNNLPILPQSISSQLARLVHCYYRIENNDYSDWLLLDELSRVILALLTSIIETLGLQEDADEIFHTGKSPHKPDRTRLELKSLELVIQLLDEYVNCQIQANNFLFEVPTYNTKFTGSLSKILLAYTWIVEMVERVAIPEIAKLPPYSSDDIDTIPNFAAQVSEPKPIPCFFTLLDYSNETLSEELFINTIQHPSYRLFSIRLDNQSFFDITTGIPFLLHELGHYIPQRYDYPRNTLLLQLTCTAVALKMVKEIILKENLVVTTFQWVKIRDDIQDLIPKIVDEMGISLANECNLDRSASNNSFREDLPGVLFSQISRGVDMDFDYSEHGESELSKVRKNIQAGYSELHGIFSQIQSQIQELIKQKLSEDQKDSLVNLSEECSALDYWTKSDLEKGILRPQIQDAWAASLEECIEIAGANDLKTKLKDLFDSLKKSWLELAVNMNDYQKQINEAKQNGLVKELFAKSEEFFEEIHKNRRIDVSEETQALANYLTANRLNEYTLDNDAFITEQILEFCTRPEIPDFIQEQAKMFIKYSNEIIADYFMCRLLRLTLEQYSALMNEYRHKVNMTDDGLEFNLREKTISETHYYQSHNATGYVSKASLDLTTTAHYQGMRLNKIKDFIDQCIEKDCLEIENLEDVRELQAVYGRIRILDSGKNDPNKFANEISAIEALWRKSYRMYEGEQ